jgi:hypothetical protein
MMNGNAKCAICAKTVYAMERMDADGMAFHKTCMKCEECNCTLKLGNYASLAGKYYCKTHYKQLFKLKGNYDDGFGREQPKMKWQKEGGLNQSQGSAPASPASSPVVEHREVAETNSSSPLVQPQIDSSSPSPLAPQQNQSVATATASTGENGDDTPTEAQPEKEEPKDADQILFAEELAAFRAERSKFELEKEELEEARKQLAADREQFAQAVAQLEADRKLFEEEKLKLQAEQPSA